MPRDKRPAGWTIVTDNRLSDAEKIDQLQAMLTAERAKNKARRQRMARTMTAITREWNELFDETYGEDSERDSGR